VSEHRLVLLSRTAIASGEGFVVWASFRKLVSRSWSSRGCSEWSSRLMATIAATERFRSWSRIEKAWQEKRWPRGPRRHALATGTRLSHRAYAQSGTSSEGTWPSGHRTAHQSLWAGRRQESRLGRTADPQAHRGRCSSSLGRARPRNRWKPLE
jgi:hypothetical protein